MQLLRALFSAHIGGGANKFARSSVCRKRTISHNIANLVKHKLATCPTEASRLKHGESTIGLILLSRRNSTLIRNNWESYNSTNYSDNTKSVISETIHKYILETLRLWDYWEHHPHGSKGALNVPVCLGLEIYLIKKGEVQLLHFHRIATKPDQTLFHKLLATPLFSSCPHRLRMEQRVDASLHQLVGGAIFRVKCAANLKSNAHWVWIFPQVAILFNKNLRFYS